MQLSWAIDLSIPEEFNSSRHYILFKYVECKKCIFKNKNLGHVYQDISDFQPDLLMIIVIIFFTLNVSGFMCNNVKV